MSAIEDVQATTRAPKASIDDAIVALCAEREQTVPELAAAIGRTVGTVRRHYLPRLLQAGLLEMRYADQPRHPQQAYRAALKAPR